MAVILDRELNPEMAQQADAEQKIAERKTVIDINVLHEAQDRLNKYREGKANLDARVIENEQWWKLQHWKELRKHRDIPEYKESNPTSAWLFNSIMNKHADAMDNYPEPTILPRERADKDAAKTLSDIVPVILDNCNYEQTYSSAWWDKLKNGSCVYGVFWNPRLLNGLGDIDIRSIDMLSIYWEPGIQNLQDSRDIFTIALIDNKALVKMYPQLEGKLSDGGVDVKKYHYDDTVDTTDKSTVVDWYYKVNNGNGDIVHYVKYCGDTVLFASEDKWNEDGTQTFGNGFYEHGRYPFVMDVLFEEKGTPAGYGFVDVMKSPQEYIDKLGGAILDNAMWNAEPRWFIRDNASVNEQEYMDYSRKLVKVAGSVDENNLRPIDAPTMPGNVLQVLQMKIDELKETSGNRDFSQGATTSGVTAASAISMLVETGSKGSRDMIRGSYRAFSDMCELIIELIRQFYDEPRAFRITGQDGQVDFVEFNNAQLQGGVTSEFGMTFKDAVPVFDIKVKAQKSNPYSKLSQNELALQFFQLGFFNPQFSDQALSTIDMMEFEGKEDIKQKIQTNGTMYQQMQQMQQTMMQMADLIAQTTGDTRILDSLAQQNMAQPVPQGGNGKMVETDSLGNNVNTGNSYTDRVKKQAREGTEVK